MKSFQPAVREWTNAAGLKRSSPHARNSESLKLLDPTGLPVVRLETYRDELWLVDADEHLVNADAPGLVELGLYGFDVKGTKNHENAVMQGDFSPGAIVELVRSPPGANDPTAIGVRAAGSQEISGYTDKRVAEAIGPDTDLGSELTVISLRGPAAGEHNGLITVLAASPSLMAHVKRNI